MEILAACASVVVCAGLAYDIARRKVERHREQDLADLREQIALVDKRIDSAGLAYDVAHRKLKQEIAAKAEVSLQRHELTAQALKALDARVKQIGNRPTLPSMGPRRT
jgi:hypothetical protein